MSPSFFSFFFFFFFSSFFGTLPIRRHGSRNATSFNLTLCSCIVQRENNFRFWNFSQVDLLISHVIFCRRTYYMHIYYPQVFENETLSKWLRRTRRVGIYIRFRSKYFIALLIFTVDMKVIYLLDCILITVYFMYTFVCTLHISVATSIIEYVDHNGKHAIWFFNERLLSNTI